MDGEGKGVAKGHTKVAERMLCIGGIDRWEVN